MISENIKNVIFDVGMVLIDFCWAQHCRNLGFSEDIIEAFDKYMISSDYWDKMDEGLLSEKEAIQEFIKVMPQLKEHGLLVGPAEHHKIVLRPPYVITKEQIDSIVDTFERLL